MPEISPDKTTAAAYPPELLYEQWRDHADELDMPISQFIIRMVEAGRKQINLEAVADDTHHELRQQRADLKTELERQRQRVKQLERQLHRTEHSDIIEFVANNPGATSPEIIQHIADTVPGRVATHLDTLEEETLDHRDDGYYPYESAE